jgi:hypothetical protein
MRLSLTPSFPSGRQQGASGLGRLSSRQRDPRESTRLELVSLACEVAVLTTHMDQDFGSLGRHPDAEEIKHSCWQHRVAAMGLLSRETSFDELSHDNLRKSVDVFRTRLQDVKHLQDRLEELQYARAAETVHSVVVALRAAHSM